MLEFRGRLKVRIMTVLEEIGKLKIGEDTKLKNANKIFRL
jgi:hypothetical protein